MLFPAILQGMMTSDDIAASALRHAQIMEQARAFTGSIGSSTTAPMPSPDQIPAFASGMSAGMLAAGAATGAAQVGAAAIGGVGTLAGFGFGGVLSKPLSMLDPMSGVFSAAQVGFSAGGGFSGLGSGSAAPIARGLAAGSLAMGGYMAAGSMFNAMTEQVTRGAQEQMMATQMLTQNINSRTLPGMSFDQGQLGHMATSLRQMSNSTTMPIGNVLSMAQAGLQSGMYQGIHTSTQFAERTRELMQTANATASVFGLGRPEDAFQLASQAQQMGFYGQGSMRSALGIGVAGVSAGIGGMSMMSAGAAGANVAGGFGVSRRQGATVAMGLAARLAGGYNDGSLDQSRMRDMMGGASLEEGVGGLAASLTQGAYAAAFDTTTLMGLVDPDTGHIDQGKALAFSSGMMGRRELRQSARRNRNDRGARMAVKARRGGLASELMEMSSPEELMAGMAMAEINDRGIRSGESADDVMNIALQKFGNMGEQQAETIKELIRAGPSMKADIAAKMQEHIRSAQAAAPNVGFIDAIKKKLVDKYVEPWAAPLRDLGASIASWGEDLADRASTALLGSGPIAQRPVSAGGRELARQMRNGGDSSYMNGAGFGGRGGMNVMGQDWVFNNDRSNFGESGGLLGDIGMSALGTGVVATGATLGTATAAGLTYGGSALMTSGVSSLEYSAAAAMGRAPLTGGMMGRMGTAGRALVGGAARVGVGGAMSLAGGVARMAFNPVSLAIAAGGFIGDLGAYTGSVDNRGTVPAEYAANMRRLGLGGEISGQAQGFFPIEQEGKSWWDGFTDVFSLGYDPFRDATADRSVSAEVVADSARLLEARMSPSAALNRGFGGNEGAIRAFRGEATASRGEIRRASYRTGTIASMVGAMSEKGRGMLAGRGLADQGALLEAALPGLLDIDSMTKGLAESVGIGGVEDRSRALQAMYGRTVDADRRPPDVAAAGLTQTANVAGDVLGLRFDFGMSLPVSPIPKPGEESFFTRAGRWLRTGDINAMGYGAGGDFADEDDYVLDEAGAVAVQDDLRGLISGGGSNLADMQDIRIGSSMADFGWGMGRRAAADAAERLVANNSKLDKRTRRLLSAMDDSDLSTMGNVIGGIFAEEARPAMEERARMHRADMTNLSRFSKATVSGASMAAALGSVGYNAMFDAAGDDLTKGTDDSREALIKRSLGLDIEQRGFSMDMLSAEQQVGVARGSRIYESMTNKRRNHGENLLGGLMNLEGARFVMDQDFTTKVMKHVNSGRGLTEGDMSEIDRLLKISKFTPEDIAKARGQLMTMADKGASAATREEAAKGFAATAGTTSGRIGGGGGGRAAGGDMAANIAAFNEAIKSAASVISNAAQGKNPSVGNP